VERARHLTCRLIDQHFARQIPPAESFVVRAHSVDAEEQCQIGVPFLTEKGRRFPHHAGGVATVLKPWNCYHTADPADERRLAVNLRAVFECGGMTDRTVCICVEDETYLFASLRAIGKLQVGCAEDVITSSPEAKRLLPGELLYPPNLTFFT
jgi:hypothetical protein